MDGMKLEQRAWRRFWSNVEKTAGCWHWLASVTQPSRHPTDGGYGRFSIRKKPIYAHRYAYERCIGKIPDGLEIDHTCRNRACVNPAHLEAVPHSVNQDRRYDRAMD